MNVKKFTALTSREALRKVRDALGPDAVILSNRAVEGGVEVLALANEDISSLSAPAAADSMDDLMPEPQLSSFAPRRHQPEPSGNLADGMDMARMPSGVASALSGGMQPSQPGQRDGFPSQREGFPTQRDGFGQPRDGFTPQRDMMPAHREPPPQAQQASALQTQREQMPPMPSMPSMPNPRDMMPAHREAMPSPRGHGAARPAASSEMAEMMQEMRAMRGLMETQLAELAWGSAQKREPQKTVVLREMLGAGFSASLSRFLIEKLPAGKNEADSLAWIKTVLERNLTTMANENEILERGGVFALVGPTGVGKTTSTAKLAARCVMRHGTGKLALITTDGYRIGGHEQLRIYGKILGVMVHSVKDEADLRIALKELQGKHTVLIDTVGVSQRDQMVEEQVAMLSGAGAEVKRLLCLNATSTGETLNEVVRAYQGGGLAGCIMTKLDEAATIGNVLDVVIRQKLNLYYVSNGQRVPEDLHLADRNFLVHRAFNSKREGSAFQFSDAELPLVMANAVSGAKDRTLGGVHLG